MGTDVTALAFHSWTSVTKCSHERQAQYGRSLAAHRDKVPLFTVADVNSVPH